MTWSRLIRLFGTHIKYVHVDTHSRISFSVLLTVIEGNQRIRGQHGLYAPFLSNIWLLSIEPCAYRCVYVHSCVFSVGVHLSALSRVLRIAPGLRANCSHCHNALQLHGEGH